jgi:hypothetical protein
MRTACLTLGAIVLLFAGPASAERGKFLGAFKSWEANTSRVGGGRVCYMSGLPKKSEGKYKKRGEASVIVTHWPKRKRFHEVSIVAGYTFKKNSKLELVIDGDRFDLYTEADRAWRYSPREDSELVRAMRKGSNMIIKGISARGTRTTDTYSLSGFTAAHNAINKACGAK